MSLNPSTAPQKELLKLSTADRSVIPVLQRLRQEDDQLEASLCLHSEFKASLGYIARPCLKKKKGRWRKRRKIIIITLLPLS
jgi:hypothetical protein